MITPNAITINLLKKIKAKEPLGGLFMLETPGGMIPKDDGLGALLDLVLHRYVIVEWDCKSTAAYPSVTEIGERLLETFAPKDRTTLSGDDLALMQMTVQEMMGLYSGRPKTEFNDERLRLMGELNTKLDWILDYVYPSVPGDLDLEHSGETIMELDYQKVQLIHDQVDRAQQKQAAEQ